MSKYDPAWYQSHKAQRLEIQRRWNAKNPEKMHAIREAYKDNPKRLAWKADHIEESRAYWRAYSKIHHKENYAIRKSDPAKVAQDHERSRMWRVQNRERIQDWKDANRDLLNVHKSRRRARLIGNGGSHTVEEWLAKRAEYGNACAYCRATGRVEKDHVVPITRGGTDDISNIVPCCRLCNLRKRQKTVEEFRALS